MKGFTKIIIGILIAVTLISTPYITNLYAFTSQKVKAEESAVLTADVFLIAGQSNAAGSTKVNATPTGMEYPYAPKTNVLYYGETHRGVKGKGTTERRIADFRPVQHGCGHTDNHVGFELGMANVLNEKSCTASTRRLRQSSRR